MAPSLRALDGSEPGARWNGKNRSNGNSRILVSNDSILATSYDFQTNGSMPDRIINWPGATGNETIMSTVLYMAAISDAASRGTYGAIYVDQGAGNEWYPIDLTSYSRLELERTGFNEVDHLSTNEIINVSHTSTAINFLIELEAATGQFGNIDIPGSDGGLWPRVSVDKTDNSIHVIWSYQVETAGEGTVAYTRTTDMGDTWSNVIKLVGDGSDLTTRRSVGGDSYQIAAANGNVVVWLMTGNVEIIQRRSLDGGATFPTDNAIFVDRPIRQRVYRPGGETPEDSTFYREDPQAGSDTTALFRSDTASAPGSGFDLMVDDDGTVRGVYPIVPSFIFGWVIDGDTSSFIYQADFSYTNAGMRYVEFNNVNEGFTSLVPQPEGLDNSSAFLDTRGFTGGLSRWAQLGKNAAGNLYLTYVSGVADDFVVGTPAGETEGQFLRGHVFVTWTRDGEAWSEPLNLTPNGTDAQFASLADLVDNELHIAYQADYYPGDFLTSSGTGGSQLHPEGVSALRAMIIETSSLPEPKAASVSDRAAVAGGYAILSTSPNPSNGMTSVTYTVGSRGTVSLKIYNTMGQEMMTVVREEKAIEGTHRVSFDATTLPSGSYMVVLTGNGGRSVQNLNVAR